nr:unnamed protein product [Digitaria exilis]
MVGGNLAGREAVEYCRWRRQTMRSGGSATRPINSVSSSRAPSFLLDHFYSLVFLPGSVLSREAGTGRLVVAEPLPRSRGREDNGAKNGVQTVRLPRIRARHVRPGPAADADLSRAANTPSSAGRERGGGGREVEGRDGGGGTGGKTVWLLGREHVARPMQWRHVATADGLGHTTTKTTCGGPAAC